MSRMSRKAGPDDVDEVSKPTAKHPLARRTDASSSEFGHLEGKRVNRVRSSKMRDEGLAVAW